MMVVVVKVVDGVVRPLVVEQVQVPPPLLQTVVVHWLVEARVYNAVAPPLLLEVEEETGRLHQGVQVQLAARKQRCRPPPPTTTAISTRALLLLLQSRPPSAPPQPLFQQLLLRRPLTPLLLLVHGPRHQHLHLHLLLLITMMGTVGGVMMLTSTISTPS